MFKFTNIALILFITAAINFVAMVVSWQRKRSGHGLYFALGMTAVTLWTAAAGFDYAAIPIASKVFFAKWEYTAYNLAFVFFAMFALSYAGYEEWLNRKPVRAFLWIIPLSNILLAWTNDWHGWLWSGFARSEFGENTVIFEHGPGYLWASATGYLMVTVIIVPLGLAWRRGSGFSRRQARLLFFASLITILGNLIYLFQASDHMGVDWTPILFSLSSLLFLWALSGTRLLDLVPIARAKLIDSLTDGMIVLDMHGRIVDINPSAIQIIGIAPEALLGKTLEEFLPFARSLADQPLKKEARFELEVGDTELRSFDVLVSPLLEGRISVIGRLILFRDITEHKHDQDELHRLARTDPLTGLYNRRYFFEIAEREFAKSIRYDRQLSVILLDIDFFKEINDTYGHLVGDQALVHIGNILRTKNRETDTLARYGGEEFVVLLPETDSQGARITAERLRKYVEDSPIHSSTDTIRLTASFGVAGRDARSAEKFDHLVSRADQALYEAKRMGRNRVICYH